VVSGGNHGELILRNLTSGAPYRTRLLEYEAEVTALSLRSVGGSSVIASGGRDGAVHVHQSMRAALLRPSGGGPAGPYSTP
jgi:hypothetical protein